MHQRRPNRHITASFIKVGRQVLDLGQYLRTPLDKAPTRRERSGEAMLNPFRSIAGRGNTLLIQIVALHGRWAWRRELVACCRTGQSRRQSPWAGCDVRDEMEFELSYREEEGLEALDGLEDTACLRDHLADEITRAVQVIQRAGRPKARKPWVFHGGPIVALQ